VTQDSPHTTRQLLGLLDVLQPAQEVVIQRHVRMPLVVVRFLSCFLRFLLRGDTFFTQVFAIGDSRDNDRRILPLL